MKRKHCFYLQLIPEKEIKKVVSFKKPLGDITNRITEKGVVKAPVVEVRQR